MHLIDAIEAASFYLGAPRSRIESVVYFADTMEIVTLADGLLQVRHDGRWTTRDDLPLAPTRMQFSRDGRRALVTSPTAWQVVDIETRESSWAAAPYAPGVIRGLFPGRGGAELPVVIDERVDLFHVAAGRVVVTGLVWLPAGQRPLAVDAAGARMITSGDRDHAIVDLESGRVTAHPGAAAAATFRHGTGESWVWIRRQEFGASSIERRARDGRRLDTLAVDASRVVRDQ